MTTVFSAERGSRMRAAAMRIRAVAPALTEAFRTGPEEQTGEQWERGQVLSHVVELLPYWAGEVGRVVDAGGGGVAFGRIKSTPSRIERIGSRRHDDPAVLLDAMDAEVERAAAVLDGLDEAQLGLIGRHQTKGEMTVAEIVDEFIAGHLEEHAVQLGG